MSMSVHEFFYVANAANGVLVRPSEIWMLEVSGNYTRVCLENGNSFLIRRRLHECEEELDPAVFFRANRQCIVNLGYVKEAYPLDAKHLGFGLTNGTHIRLSRGQSVELRKQFSL